MRNESAAIVALSIENLVLHSHGFRVNCFLAGHPFQSSQDASVVVLSHCTIVCLISSPGARRTLRARVRSHKRAGIGLLVANRAAHPAVNFMRI